MAREVIPVCRGPRKDFMGARRFAVFNNSRLSGRLIMSPLNPEISEHNSDISGFSQGTIFYSENTTIRELMLSSHFSN